MDQDQHQQEIVGRFVASQVDSISLSARSGQNQPERRLSQRRLASDRRTTGRSASDGRRRAADRRCTSPAGHADPIAAWINDRVRTYR